MNCQNDALMQQKGKTRRNPVQERSDHATLSTSCKTVHPSRPNSSQKAGAPDSSYNSRYAANDMQFKPPYSARNTPDLPPMPALDTPSQRKKSGLHWAILVNNGRHESTYPAKTRGLWSHFGQPPRQLHKHLNPGTNDRTNQGGSEMLRTSNQPVQKGTLLGNWKSPCRSQELSNSASKRETLKSQDATLARSRGIKKDLC